MVVGRILKELKGCMRIKGIKKVKDINIIEVKEIINPNKCMEMASY